MLACLVDPMPNDALAGLGTRRPVARRTRGRELEAALARTPWKLPLFVPCGGHDIYCRRRALT